MCGYTQYLFWIFKNTLLYVLTVLRLTYVSYEFWNQFVFHTNCNIDKYLGYTFSRHFWMEHDIKVKEQNVVFNKILLTILPTESCTLLMRIQIHVGYFKYVKCLTTKLINPHNTLTCRMEHCNGACSRLEIISKVDIEGNDNPP